jgi:hypothetical protein
MLHHEAPAPIATGSGWPLTQDDSGGNSPTERGLRSALPGSAGSRWRAFLSSPRARTKAQFNGVGRLRTYISFTRSVF